MNTNTNHKIVEALKRLSVKTGPTLVALRSNAATLQPFNALTL